MTIWTVDADGIITERTYDNIANYEAWGREMDDLYGSMWFDTPEEALNQAEACINIDLDNFSMWEYIPIRVSDNLLAFDNVDIYDYSITPLERE